MISLRRYQKKYESDWNRFVSGAANATFLFNRGYMDYHKDRFTDHSVLLYENSQLSAIFPANEKEDGIFSHGGLTYGGLMVKDLKLIPALSCFKHIMNYYKKHGITHVHYKPVPVFFHTQPNFTDFYALFLAHAKLISVNTGFACDLRHGPTISARRMRMVEKAKKQNITIVKAPDCSSFWNDILIPHLAHKFNTKPVHTLSEIELLRHAFPTNILQYNANLQGHIVAGVTIFWDRGVAHTQYIASNEEGRKSGALDYVCWHLMTQEFKNARFFSFGTANMDSPDGSLLSWGLIEWKEGFGATMYPYPCYEIKTK